MVVKAKIILLRHTRPWLYFHFQGQTQVLIYISTATVVHATVSWYMVYYTSNSLLTFSFKVKFFYCAKCVIDQNVKDITFCIIKFETKALAVPLVHFGHSIDALTFENID